MTDGELSVRATRAKKLWDFAWINLLAVGGALALFFAVLYGDASTGVFAAVWAWFSDHQALMALTAATPFFAALLVGRASAAKAKRRRLAEARRAAVGHDAGSDGAAPGGG